MPHCCHGLDAQRHAAARGVPDLQVVRELRAGIEFKEDFPGSDEFYQRRFGTPLRARRPGEQVGPMAQPASRGLTFINASLGASTHR